MQRQYAIVLLILFSLLALVLLTLFFSSKFVWAFCLFLLLFFLYILDFCLIGSGCLVVWITPFRLLFLFFFIFFRGQELWVVIWAPLLRIRAVIGSTLLHLQCVNMSVYILRLPILPFCHPVLSTLNVFFKQNGLHLVQRIILLPVYFSFLPDNLEKYRLFTYWTIYIYIERRRIYDPPCISLLKPARLTGH